MRNTKTRSFLGCPKNSKGSVWLEGSEGGDSGDQRVIGGISCRDLQIIIRTVAFILKDGILLEELC